MEDGRLRMRIARENTRIRKLIRKGTKLINDGSTNRRCNYWVREINMKNWDIIAAYFSPH